MKDERHTDQAATPKGKPASPAKREQVIELAGERSGQPDTPTRLLIAGQIREGQRLDEKRDVRVTVIRGGASINGYSYNAEILQAIAGLLENAQAYVDHTNGPTRSVRDVVGFYRDASFVPADAETPDGRVEATLHVLESADWLWCSSRLRESTR